MAKCILSERECRELIQSAREKQHLLVFMCFSVTECHGEVFGDKK